MFSYGAHLTIAVEAQSIDFPLGIRLNPSGYIAGILILTDIEPENNKSQVVSFYPDQDDKFYAETLGTTRKAAALGKGAATSRCDCQLLEVKPSAELQRTRQVGIIGAGEVGDVAEGATTGLGSRRYCRVWVGDQLWMVQQVEGLDANLELTLAKEVETTEDACVEIGYAGSTELIASGVTEARSTVRVRSWVGKTCRIKPGVATVNGGIAWCAVVPSKLSIRFNQIGILRIAWRVDSRTRWTDRERRSADVAQLAIQLPATCNGAGDSVIQIIMPLAKRQVVDCPDLQVVCAIIARCRLVEFEISRVGERRSSRPGTSPVIGIVDGVRPGVDHADLRQTARITGQL